MAGRWGRGWGAEEEHLSGEAGRAGGGWNRTNSPGPGDFPKGPSEAEADFPHSLQMQIFLN